MTEQTQTRKWDRIRSGVLSPHIAEWWIYQDVDGATIGSVNQLTTGEFHAAVDNGTRMVGLGDGYYEDFDEAMRAVEDHFGRGDTEFENVVAGGTAEPAPEPPANVDTQPLGIRGIMYGLAIAAVVWGGFILLLVGLS